MTMKNSRRRRRPNMARPSLRSLITRNWKEKLVALFLAFLFWYLVKIQISNDPFAGERRVRSMRL
jgi:hypothetical protein